MGTKKKKVRRLSGERFSSFESLLSSRPDVVQAHREKVLKRTGWTGNHDLLEKKKNGRRSGGFKVRVAKKTRAAYRSEYQEMLSGRERKKGEKSQLSPEPVSASCERVFKSTQNITAVNHGIFEGRWALGLARVARVN